MNEFALIGEYLAPLAKDFPGSLGLADDAALLFIPPGMQLVVTKDAISEGVHFIGEEEPSLIARKLLRMNLSDLAAKGATPYCYFLSLALPAPLSESYLASFTKGLAEDQQQFAIHLAGGDTITTHGTATFSLTALGLVPEKKMLRRSTANAGDQLCVSGTLGDAALGLMAVKEKIAGYDALIQRYHLPEPRIALGESLRHRATACMDISDGLLQDAGHLCRASGVGLEIHYESLPLSEEATQFLTAYPDRWPLVVNGGDDYELLFTLPEHAAPPEGCTVIGRVVTGKGVTLLKNGAPVFLKTSGFSH